MSGRLTEQEFVAHVFAPLDGPAAADALAQVRALWANCETHLGMTLPIDGVGLPVTLPVDPAAAPEGALAGRQDRTVDFQAVARREHDVLNVSLVMATPLAAPRRRLGIGSAVPPGWHEFARWWGKLVAGGTGHLLGTAVVFQAKARAATDADVRGALPPRDDDAAGWWTRRHTADDFTVWEASTGAGHPDRRLVVLARPGEDARLSRFTWSAGDVALPPLGHYLLHAAKVRYQARVRGDGRQLADARDRVAGRLDRLTGLLADPAGRAEAEAATAVLSADVAALAGTLEAVRRMRRTVEIGRSNMTAVLDAPLPADAALVSWLERQLADDAEYLDATRRWAEQVLAIPAAPAPAAPVRDRPREGRVEQRLGFGVDVVSYSSRSTPQQAAVQRRLAGVVARVLERAGLEVYDTDRQDAGDGMMVVLPAGVAAHVALPHVLLGWRDAMDADNRAHPEDRIRVRLSVGAGPFATADIGFTGATIIEIGRLLDSPALRAAVDEHPDADVVALVSDRLYRDVVGEGHPGLAADEFRRCPVRVKTFRADAWLWAGWGRGGGRRHEAAATEPSARSVVVAGGGDRRAFAAMAGLLRALDLRPVDADRLAERTGSAAPHPGDVLRLAFAECRAVVVLLGPDDDADVLFTAGMAAAMEPDRTVIAAVGPRRPPSGVADRTVRLGDGDPAELHRFAGLLHAAGCAVDTADGDWLDPDRFR